MNKKYVKPLLATLSGEKAGKVPFWFMRQAGRYLPEYRELRSKAGSFLDFCYNPKMASEATLQPIRRFGMDGAIIFSDILLVPQALGVPVRFEEKIGPLLEPVADEKALAALDDGHVRKKLSPVYEALQLTRASLPKETTLIGFAGAPWTLACYVIQGKGDGEFARARTVAEAKPAFFAQLLTLLAGAVTQHILGQIEAGAEVIQIFDSWAGVLDDRRFADWVIAPTKAIVSAVKKAHPDVPVIGFPRQAGGNYLAYAQETGVDALSIDPAVALDHARDTLQAQCIIQGNLEPALLAEDKPAMLAAAAEIVAALGHKPFVFNLGHGILPHTPIAHVEALCHFLKA